jgi:hypothetical protein
VYEQPSVGRRVGPALIAFLVVAAIAAGALGYFGAKSMLKSGSSGNQASGTATSTTIGSTPTKTTPGVTRTSAGGGGNPTSTGGQTITNVPAGDKTTCPQATVDAVAGLNLDATNIVVLLYIRVHRANEYDSEVWICRNAAGVLIYQGHILREPLTKATSLSSLLLVNGANKGMVMPEGTGFVASNPSPDGKTTTEYHVSLTQLVTVKQPGNQERNVYPVIDSYHP